MLYCELKDHKIKYRNHEGGGVYVTAVEGATERQVSAYAAELSALGFSSARYTLGGNVFYTLLRGEDAVYLAFYPADGSFYIVEEPASAYPGFSCPAGESVTTPVFCQLDLHDYGLSDVIRISDGRFIVIDGGWENELDSDELYSRLEQLSEGREIVIAAWIMTHPHLDHYRNFFSFMPKYERCVKVERMLYNFPGTGDEDAVNVPLITQYDERANIDRFESMIRDYGIPSYRPHTGQTYDVGDAHIEILGSPDENFEPPVSNANNISLVFKMTLGGNTVFITGDYQFYVGTFTKKWGDYVRSDIHQLSHHAFHGETKELMRLVAAPTCVIPSFEDDVYKKIGTKYSYFHLMLEMEQTREVLVGSHTGGDPDPACDIVLHLPHTPDPKGRERIAALVEKYGTTRDSITVDM